VKNLNAVHGHAWLVGIVGLAVGLFLMIYVPTLKGVSGVILLMAVMHLVGATVFFGSLFGLAPKQFARAWSHLRPRRSTSDTNDFDFGWSWGWMNGLWLAALALGAGAVAVQVAAPAWWPAAFGLLLLAVGFFAGGLSLRSTRRLDEAVLPLVRLLSGGCDLVLDAGCGAGRTTIALAKVVKQGRIVAVDRFDAGYIEDGGRALLDRNLRLARIVDQVRIEAGDIASLPFPDATFDSAASAHVIDHLGPHKQRGLDEIRRVLKPGGRFLMVIRVPGWTMFAMANVLSFFLTSKRQWRDMARRAGFERRDEGAHNGCWFLLLERPAQ
jgi:SAM-dependent methyltransferase